MTKPEERRPRVRCRAHARPGRALAWSLSPRTTLAWRTWVEVMAELRTLVMEGDDDAPADETLLALAIERARARTSK